MLMMMTMTMIIMMMIDECLLQQICLKNIGWRLTSISYISTEKLLSLQRERAERRAKEEQEKREATMAKTDLSLDDISEGNLAASENVVEVSLLKLCNMAVR